MLIFSLVILIYLIISNFTIFKNLYIQDKNGIDIQNIIYKKYYKELKTSIENTNYFYKKELNNLANNYILMFMVESLIINFILFIISKLIYKITIPFSSIIFFSCCCCFIIFNIRFVLFYFTIINNKNINKNHTVNTKIKL